jgi:5-formyltetrahydrofolate cyclo-ligase
MEPKSALRTRITLMRARRSAPDREDAGRRLAARALPAWQGLGTVAAYAAVGSEPPTRPLLDGLRDAGVKVWLPVVDGEGLSWAAYTGWDQLVSGPFGLREPTGDRHGGSLVRRADLVVVPALAVDGRGMRLGRGGGYYDRALSTARRPVVAVVYDDELLDEIPTEPHDLPVDAVLTPDGLTAAGRPGARSVPGVTRGR